MELNKKKHSGRLAPRGLTAWGAKSPARTQRAGGFKFGQPREGVHVLGSPHYAPRKALDPKAAPWLPVLATIYRFSPTLPLSPLQVRSPRAVYQRR